MPETRQRPENDCPVCFLAECDCPCATCSASRARRERDGTTSGSEFARALSHSLEAVMEPDKRQHSAVRDDERVRLPLVIDAEAGSDHADREAERLGLTIHLAAARARRVEEVARASAG